MEIVKPIFFDSFRCIADRCPDTCCVGWDVEIDNNTAEQYKSEKGVLKKYFDTYLTTDEDGYIFSLKDGRCPLLDAHGLCLIQLQKGENNVCETCRLFPRYYDDYGDIRETGLGLGCPEVARLLLLPQTEVRLDKKAESSDRIYNLLDEKREEFFKILDDDRLDTKMKLSAVLFSAAELQGQIDNTDFPERTAPLPLQNAPMFWQKWNTLTSAAGIFCSPFARKEQNTAIPKNTPRILSAFSNIILCGI